MENFILEFPQFSRDNYFNYGVITFLLLIVGIIVGILICFKGYKYFQTLCILLMGCLCGVAGIWIADGMTRNPVGQMSFFVIFTFFGICFCFFITQVAASIFQTLKIKRKLLKALPYVAAVIGAGVTCGLVYGKVYRSLPVAAVLFALLAIGGSLYGRKKLAEGKVFHTYDDLCRMIPYGKKECEKTDA